MFYHMHQEPAMSPRTAFRRPSQSGFTLVELAIVLMIIGLLIAGILRGQEVLNITRMNRTVKDVQSYIAAIHIFKEKYDGLPGDLRLATSRMPGCSTASNCVNGNGDGKVGTPNLLWIGGQQAVATENTQFWKHLALSNMITGVNPVTNTVAWGSSHPASPMGGGFTVIWSTQDPADPTGSAFNGALALRMHGDLVNGIVDQSPTVTPHQAAYIDRKLDDGFANQGTARGYAAGAAGPQAQQDCEAKYNEGNERILCIMGFVLAL